MSDVYAEFGVSNASVISSGELTDHEKAMIDMPVSVRDGDDLIQASQEQEPEVDTSHEQEEPKQAEEELEDEEPKQAEEELEDEEPKGDADVQTAADDFQKYVAEQDALLAEGIAKGLPENIKETLQAEYEAGEGFSEKSYKELEKAGYSRTFVDSYMRGQEALAERFVQSIYDFSGGKAQFEHVASFMGTHNKDLADTFNDAVARSDGKAIKAIINTAKAQMEAMFGTKPKRDVTLRAKPVVNTKPASTVKPFSNSAEMVAAMSDKRYQSDATYRAEVEKRVAISQL